MALTLDQFVVGLLEGYVRKAQPTRADMLLGNGLGVVIRGVVQAAGVPDVTGDEIAAGLLNAVGIGKNPRLGVLHRPVARGRILRWDPASGAGNPRVIDVQAEVIR